MRMMANKEHPDYTGYIKKCRELLDEYTRRDNETPKPEIKGFDGPWDVNLDWYLGELKVLQKEYAYLFTIPYDENSN